MDFIPQNWLVWKKLHSKTVRGGHGYKKGTMSATALTSLKLENSCRKQLLFPTYIYGLMDEITPNVISSI